LSKVVRRIWNISLTCGRVTWPGPCLDFLTPQASDFPDMTVMGDRPEYSGTFGTTG